MTTRQRYERLRRLFGEACSLSHDERRALLDRACADDAALRREIDALLIADARGEDFPLVPPRPDRGDQEANRVDFW